MRAMYQSKVGLALIDTGMCDLLVQACCFLSSTDYLDTFREIIQIKKAFITRVLVFDFLFKLKHRYSMNTIIFTSALCDLCHHLFVSFYYLKNLILVNCRLTTDIKNNPRLKHTFSNTSAHPLQYFSTPASLGFHLVALLLNPREIRTCVLH